MNDNNNLEKQSPPEQIGTPPVAGDSKKDKTKKISAHGIILIILMISVIACVGTVIYRFYNWGDLITQEEIFKDGLGEYKDTFDLLLPVFDTNGNPIEHGTGKDLDIMIFGNAPFADDRDSKDGLANMLADMTGANIYNCSISNSYMACEEPFYNGEQPMDAYSLYSLVLYGIYKNPLIYDLSQEAMGNSVPDDIKDTYEILTDTDLSDIDVFVILYDAYDYLLGHAMYSDTNSFDVTQFTGALDASIAELQQNCPNSRIIVLSPPYAFSDVKDASGNYISSDVQTYGWDVLSTYVIKEYTTCAERQVTFVDNLYGTITEDNAKSYLRDNLHLNVKGRKKIAERLVYAINYFNEK